MQDQFVLSAAFTEESKTKINRAIISVFVAEYCLVCDLGRDEVEACERCCCLACKFVGVRSIEEVRPNFGYWTMTTSYRTDCYRRISNVRLEIPFLVHVGGVQRWNDWCRVVRLDVGLFASGRC